MSDAAALLPEPDAGVDDHDLLRRLADILAGRREGGLSLDEAEALAPRNRLRGRGHGAASPPARNEPDVTPRFRRMGDPHGVYPAPREIDPTKVADLMDVSGREMCMERWHWICPRDLSDLTSEGRDLIKAGLKWPGPRAARRRGPAPRQAKNESLS